VGARVGIIGAGMSGLCLASRLREAGIETFTLYEKADEVGGVWRENTYPGLSCDVPSRCYCFSFAPNPGWTRLFAPAPEVKQYFIDVSQRLGLYSHIRFGAEVREARWQDGRWRLRLSDDTDDEVDVLVSATGTLHHPRTPEIDGLESFAGEMFHTARWDHSVELSGRRVGVIGQGSTGTQVVTSLAGTAAHLTLFQRTPQWVVPVTNITYRRFTRALFARFPALSRFVHRAYTAVIERVMGKAALRPGWQRTLLRSVCRLHLRFSVRDPELRRKLTPDHEPMCKRQVVSDGFYRALQRPDVELVDDPIERIEPEGVLTGDGRVHGLDVLILATGFDFLSYMRPLELVGVNGRTLAESWAGGPHAYLTVALPGFPNFFMMTGPHSPLATQTHIASAETQAGYIAQWAKRIDAGDVAAAMPTEEATDLYNRRLREAMPETVWMSGGCTSYYVDADGIPQVWPWSPDQHRAMLETPVDADFELQLRDTVRTYI
jgi:cation diffusion facilitator CzcD-associated flavoprotein CzcO